jgi:signal transduction histidine kinase
VAPGSTSSAPTAAASLWQRLLPRTLFGRLVLVLGTGLLVAQLLSAAVNVAERESLLAGHYGLQPAQRIADVVGLLDRLGGAERERVVSVLRVPPLVLSLADSARLVDSTRDTHAGMFAAHLRTLLGADREVRVQSIEHTAAPPGMGGGMPEHAPMRGMGPGMMGGGAGAAMAAMRTEVKLQDGRWARFDAELPRTPQALPLRLALTLLVLLASVLALSYIAVRWVVRPLQQLTRAAEALGEDLDRAPLPEEGPREVQQAARAFNTMQRRLAAFLDERTRMLAALSHDLKTPLTRMRLRAELLDDEPLRTRFEADLREMETMVKQTLDFMRGLGGHEAPQAVDVIALLEALQSDQEALGHAMKIEGHTIAPFVGVASLLKRALGNLLDNAFAFGTQATVRVDDSAAQLVLHIADNGPGIPNAELERVFEPFHRLEGSRSRATGGTGLGLSIARSIARSHGGDVALRNAAQGGLDAVMTLPRTGTAGKGR